MLEPIRLYLNRDTWIAKPSLSFFPSTAVTLPIMYAGAAIYQRKPLINPTQPWSTVQPQKYPSPVCPQPKHKMSINCVATSPLEVLFPLTRALAWQQATVARCCQHIQVCP